MLCRAWSGNGIKGIKKLSPEELQEYEPHATGLSALYCPETGIVDYQQVCEKLSEDIQKKCEIITDAPVTSIDHRQGITIAAGATECKTRFLINCAGLFSDQVAELAGMERQSAYRPIPRILYAGQARHLIKNLIYPIPDPRLPFWVCILPAP